MKLTTKGASEEDKKILIDTFPQLAKVMIDKMNELELGNHWFPTMSFAVFVVLKMFARQANPQVDTTTLVKLFCSNVVNIAKDDEAADEKSKKE